VVTLLYYIVRELERRAYQQSCSAFDCREGFDPFGYSHGRASGLGRFFHQRPNVMALDFNRGGYDGRRTYRLNQAAIGFTLLACTKMF